MSRKNYFLGPDRAARYDQMRPSFHKEALEAFHDSKPTKIYHRSLDVGCGTGQSSLALAEWSTDVCAIDASESMLKHASSHPAVHYMIGEAENLPFTDHQFDLVFVASSLHWFERRKFLSEVSRVLRPGGKFLIYDSYIVEGLKDFSRQYSEKFPRPYEDVPLIDFELDFFNLSKKNIFKYNFDKNFSQDSIVNYFMNLSNVAASLERGEQESDIRRTIESLVSSCSVGESYIFQVQLTEIIRRA